MKYFLQFVIAIVGLPIGRILAFVPLAIFVWSLEKIAPKWIANLRAGERRKQFISSLYMDRVFTGAMVSSIYWTALIIFEFDSRTIFTAIFGIWTIFFSEPFIDSQAIHVFDLDFARYESVRRKLKIVRIISYFAVSPFFMVIEALIKQKG